MAGRSGVPATGPRLLRLDAVRSLAAFFGVGGLLCWAAVVLPHDQSVDGPVVSAVAAAAVAVSGALLLARRVPSWLLVTLVAGGSGLIALLVRAGHGTAQAVGFAAFIVWVVVYSACFFHARTAAVQGLVGVGGISLGWAGSAEYWVPLLLAAAAAVTTALVVGDLVHRVRAAADTDPLTGLCTLAGMIRRGDPLLAAAARSGEPIAVLLLQIRGLGQVVESMGHAAGEELVNRAGAVLEPVGRADGAVGARVSGDRLACLLPAASLTACQGRAGAGPDGAPPTLTDGAVWAAQETLRRIRGPHRLAGVDVQLEGHVGVVVVTRTGDDLPALLRAGEVALTEAVRRDTPVLVHDARLGSRGAEALRVLAELRDAIPAGQLRVHYQVQVGAHSGRPASVEALVRWQHPRRGLLAPGAFVPIAEPTEVIIDLTRWVLDEALRQCAAWLDDGFRVPVSVNLSARLLGHAPLLGEVLGRLREHGVPPELLTVEITETALVTHLEPAAVLLGALRGHGVRTSIDDFGTGQTSLALLADLPFDELKIDRGFVTAGRLDPRAEAVVTSVLQLGHGLGQQVVAEGIEDEATAHWLAELGCDLLQGYHHGRPGPAADLVDLPRTRSAVEADPAVYAGHAPVLPALREEARIAALRRLGVLDTPAETAFDDLAALAAQVCGTSIALVSLVDSDRQWFKAAVGCDMDATPRSQSFCAHALDRADVLEVPDARADPRFADNPLVTGPPHVRFYAGAPLRTDDGHVVGTLCVLDVQPRALTEAQRTGLATLADTVAARLQQRARRPALDTTPRTPPA